MAEIIGVTFKPGGKVYYFAPGDGEYTVGKGVIVETARGTEYATVANGRTEVDDATVVQPLKPVVRIATKRDEETHKRNVERRPEALKTVKEKIEQFNLDMKLIDCEFAFDGSKAVFYYSAPQRVDFRELVKELSSTFRMRIELRQVGIRDEIKLIGGLAPCGRECCCASCMPEIKKVSIKMAKNQGLSLNPVKISGLCGRLMCCLGYENDYYSDACKRVPKIGSEVGTPDGKGVVVNTDMLKMTVRVKIEDRQKDTVSFRDYPVEELKFRRAGCENCGGDGEEESEAEDSQTISEETGTANKISESRTDRPTNKPADGKPAEKKFEGKPREGGRNRNRKRRENKKNS